MVNIQRLTCNGFGYGFGYGFGKLPLSLSLRVPLTGGKNVKHGTLKRTWWFYHVSCGLATHMSGRTMLVKQHIITRSLP